jgi:hypothetical protein
MTSLGRQRMTRAIAYSVIDSFGRSYYGQTFESRYQAISAAKKITWHDRPYGVWIAQEDEGFGEEIHPAIKMEG